MSPNRHQQVAQPHQARADMLLAGTAQMSVYAEHISMCQSIVYLVIIDCPHCSFLFHFRA
jgi:hypothetical protein